MNFVEYYTDVEGLNSCDLKLKCKIDRVEGIDIKIFEEDEVFYPKSKLKIHVKLIDNITNVDENLKSTLNVANDILNILIFRSPGKFGTLRRGRFNINGQGVIGVGEITLYNIHNVSLQQEFLSILESDLQNNGFLKELKNNSYHRLYRNAMQTDDVVARYMFLYGIIYDIQNSSQNQVDSYIDSIEPTIEKRNSTDVRHPNKQITKYTWLRNEIGHTNSSTDIKAVEKEIAEVCDAFAKVVRGVI